MMSSLEEDELMQMVRDFIESESPQTSSIASSSKTHSLDNQQAYLTLKKILARVTNAEIQVLEKIPSYLSNPKTALCTNNIKNWVVRRLNKDGFEASLCKTSWASTTGSPAGEYVCIDVMMENKRGGKQTRVIVDLDFRSQFELARPTSTYTQLTNILPSIFVGTEEKLKDITTLLCSAAKQSLKERGLHIPPWRKARYMQSKWLSEDCKKERFTPKSEPKNGVCGNWVPPNVKPKRMGMAAGSGGLSIQFADMGINCC